MPKWGIFQLSSLFRVFKIKTQLLDDLQTGQYVGIVIFIIGLLPWFQYIMMGFGTKGGAWAFDKLVHK